MKLLSILLLTVTIYFTYQQKATETRKGVIFNLYQRILQTERFVKLDLLVPFPQYDQKVDGRLANLTNEIEQLWTKDNYGCPLNYTNMTENTHGLRWIAQQVANENLAAQLDIAILKGQTPTIRDRQSIQFRKQKETRCSISSSCRSISIGTWPWSRRQSTLCYKICVWRMR